MTGVQTCALPIYYVIASMHRPIFKSGTADENTRAYIKTMENPNVNIIGHCDDEKFPVDYFALFRAAMENHVLLEINNSSLSPDGYRGDTTYADLLILNLSKHFNYPVLFSSDSHGIEHIGDFQYAEALARKADRKSTRLNSSHRSLSRMPSSA